MKNINKDYLVIVNARTAEIKVPENMKFYMTDELTCNMFFQLIFEDSDSLLVNSYAPKEKANFYYLTLRVVKPNNEPLTIQATPLDEHYCFFIADLTTDFVNIPGICECELFIDTKIPDKDGIPRIERSTTEPFEYEVKESIFYNLDNIVDEEYISIENIATKEYVEGLVTGNISLDGYATKNQLAYKADMNHTHDQYATKTQLNDAIASVDCQHVNLEDFTVSNSISINRSEHSVIGQYSTAEGDNTAATGHASHSEGYNTAAIGDYSHSEGNGTKAKNYSSHAEGVFTVSNHEGAHSEGCYTESNGYASHSEGYYTIANGRYQHVQGKYNISDFSTYAHIVGNGADSENRSNAHTLDWDGNAWFAGNVTVGLENKVLATEDFINGRLDGLATKQYVDDAIAKIGENSGGDNGGNNGNDNTGDDGNGDNTGDNGNENPGGDDPYVPPYDDTDLKNTITELRGLIDSKSDKTHTHDEYITQNELEEAINGIDINTENMTIKDLIVTNSISMGRLADTEVGQYSTAIGENTTANRSCAHAEGYGTTASKVCAHAEGHSSIANGLSSHAEGQSTEANGDHSHSEGCSTEANGNCAHAEGSNTVASGFAAHSEGCDNTASGYASHTEGCETKAKADYSHAEGLKTSASSECQHVQGKLNIEDTENRYAHIVGNGTSYTALSNAHTLDWEGNGWFAKDVYVGGTSQDDGNKLLSTSDIYFTEDGDLAITINGITKYFTPKN